MARLKSHGIELDRREYPTYRVAVMSDGNIMRDSGSGWKLWRKIKPGVDINKYAQESRAKYDSHPAVIDAYIKAIKEAVSIQYRAILHRAVQLMPTDPDGVFSEVNEFHFDSIVDLSDCVTLCRLYQEWQRLVSSNDQEIAE